MMKLGDGYLITLIVMALNVVIGGAVCKALNFSQPTSYALGFSSVFVLAVIFVFIDDWIDGIKARRFKDNERD